MRIFIGVSLSEELIRIAESFKKQNSRLEGVRWVKPHNLHLTVSFLGEVPDNKIQEISTVLKEICTRHKKHFLLLEKIDFSPGKKPYMFWMYFRMDEAFQKMYEEINRTLNENPYRSCPTPHVTLARFKKAHYFYKPVFPEVSNQKLVINELILFRSFLEKQGARYQELKRFKLAE